MTSVLPRIVTVVQRKLRTSVGKRFSRFVLVAVAAVAASQITLTICLGPVRMTAGRSAVAAWLAGAAVSYVLSRWAWERKGRPNLLKETLPFWTVSVGTAVVLTLTTKFANQQALSMGLSHVQRVLFADAAYFVANCVTFLTRFLIFHYVLFVDRGATPVLSDLSPAAPSEVHGHSAAERPSTSEEATVPGPLAATGSGARAGGSPVWAGSSAERSPGRRPSADAGALPEPGTRR